MLQTVYLKVIEGRAKFAGRSTFKTWLFAVIRTTAADRRRFDGLRRLGLVKRAALDAPAPALQPDVAADERARRERILAALKTLSQRQREVLELVFYQDLTVEEAAEVMGVGVGSARVHYDRGKKAILAALGTEIAR